MAKNEKHQLPAVSIGDSLGELFAELENRIRERAYHIFLDRDPEGGDPVGDWLAAQEELVSPVELEIKEQKKNIIVQASLEGFAPTEIEIEIEGDTLKIFGSHTETGKSGKHGKGRVEKQTTSSRHFYRSITLPAPVDVEHSHAKLLKNGKLKVTLHRVTPLQ